MREGVPRGREPLEQPEREPEHHGRGHDAEPHPDQLPEPDVLRRGDHVGLPGRVEDQEAVGASSEEHDRDERTIEAEVSHWTAAPAAPAAWSRRPPDRPGGRSRARSARRAGRNRAGATSRMDGGGVGARADHVAVEHLHDVRRHRGAVLRELHDARRRRSAACPPARTRRTSRGRRRASSAPCRSCPRCSGSRCRLAAAVPGLHHGDQRGAEAGQLLRREPQVAHLVVPAAARCTASAPGRRSPAPRRTASCR